VWHSPEGLRLGVLQYGIRAPIFNIEPGWPCKWKLKKKFQSKLLSKWKKFKFQSVHECQEGN
jgi:hypothetical protein